MQLVYTQRYYASWIFVDSFEPDISHADFKKLINSHPNNTFYQMAVSNYSGNNFYKIVNNSTELH